MPRRLLAIIGPTGVGKTEVGLLVAAALGGEIVSADSMQCYRGMDIGTAKSTGAQRARVPHHLIDVVEPDEPFSVATYQTLADAALEDIWQRGRQPLLVGGSGLYVRAVVDGLDFPIAPADADFRRRLLEEAKRVGREALHERLAAVDPEAAARIHPNNVKRVIRALEVHAQTGRPISQAWALDREKSSRYNTRQFGLQLARAELYRQIERRIDQMIADGLVAEVKALLARGYGEDLVSMKGLGYAQLAIYLRGRCSLEEAVRRLKRDTRRFAKRQLTWFRADPRIEWVDVAEVGGPAEAADRIREKWEQGQCGPSCASA